MNDWTAGYVAEIGYTFGYYSELNPLRARLAFLDAGFAPPATGTHCELGFGQGVSVNLHAAASRSPWYATDFNPAQASFAKSLARASGADVHLYDEAFSDFCARSDLPDFESIGLHGIWSWISDGNRAVIVDFIRRKLKVGGLLYVSYNTQPGWAATVPLRDLLTEHANVMGVPGFGLVSRIDGALAFAEKLMAANPAYARANPKAADTLNEIKKFDRHYLAHEYFNRDWLPMPFSRMAEWLAPAKLNYVCSARYLDHIDPLNLSAEQQALLKDILDPMFRETVRDFCVNQQFRSDYWVKGAQRLTSPERVEAVRALRVILITARSQVSLKAKGALGEAGLAEAVYVPVLDVLGDHVPRRLGQLDHALSGKLGFGQLLQAILVLTGKGDLAAAQDDEQIADALPTTQRLNDTLLDKARGSSDISYLASPVTGGGVKIDRLQQLFSLARGQGQTTPESWAQFAWQILDSQGQRLLKDGIALATTVENVAELVMHAKEFAEMRLPVLKALQIA